MALVVKDRVRVTTTTTGTTDFTLGSAVTGYQSFSVIGNGNQTYYAAQDPATGDWEVGIGTYSSTGPTLSRDTILESSNAGSKVVFAAGSKDVFCTYPAERSVYLDVAGSYPVQSTFDTITATTATLTNGTITTTPTDGIDLVNKTYVDTIAGTGLTYHAAVNYESPNTVGNLTATYTNGGTTPTWTTITNNKEVATGSAHGLLEHDVIVFSSTTNGITAGTAYFVKSTPTSTSITLSLTYDGAEITSLTNGTGLSIGSRANSGVGATLVNAGTQTALVIDGVSVVVGNRVLIYSQTNAYENGVYEVTNVGSGSTNWILTRTSDANKYGPLSTNTLGQNDAFYVLGGNTGKGETYVLSTTGTIVFGTTSLSFTQISSAQVYSAGTGLNLSPATTFNISNTGVVAATYGSASTVPVIAVNAQGQITSATNTSIAITAGAVSGLAASATTDTTNAANISSGTLNSARLSGSYTGITGVGTLTAGTWNASTISVPYGGTGITSYAVGDLIYANTTTSLAKLPDVATGNALLSGGVGTAPAWGKVGLTTHVSGTLAVSNGGTGATSLTGYVKGNGTSAFTASATIPNADTTATSANTANAIVARDASGNFSAGTITASLSGNATSATSATSATTATNLAGGTAGALPYQSGSGTTLFTAAGTAGQYLQSNGTSAPSWTTFPTIGNGTLTLNVSGTGLSGSASFTANQSGNTTFTVTSNATSANTASTIVARDASGNFSAGTITASLSGNATSATSATSAGSVTNSVTFNNGGSGDASGTSFNGSAARTISYNTVGASPLAGSASLTTTGTVTSGTWSASFGAVSGANLTNLTAGNLTGTIPSAVLGNSSLNVGTTSIALNRASADQALTGISSVTFPGATSGTIQLIPAATAGTGTVLTMPATTGTILTTGAAVTVAQGGTGITSGTSGGVPYFSSTSTIASSAALAANALVVGGGAGAAPSTITTGTGVVTALGVNTGTSGAFVVNGGALGTPSSGTVTNLTGTASININGTVGATTPTTGAFTEVTISANSTNPALKLTQQGTGAVLLAEDSTSPDSTPTVIDTNGNIILGKSSRLVGVANKAEVHSTTTETSGLLPSIGLYNWNANASARSYLSFFHYTSGTVGTVAGNASGDNLGTIRFHTRDSSTGDLYFASIDATTASSLTAVNLSYTANSHAFSGPITSGTWNGSAIGVPYGGTGITSGTSGGVPYFSASNTIASSAALAANALVIGGGAGAAPSTITTGTGVVTALGVNTGTAGAFVVNGGALGTPSSGTVTNLTGTASININGTVGATTPNTGAFTSITSTSASGILTRAAATQDGVELIGRAGGTLSYKVSLTPTTLSASRTLTLPDNSGTVLTTGATVAVSNGGTGQTSYTNGELLIGNTTGNTLTKATLTGTSNQITVTNGAGSITLATPQSIGTSSSVQFGSFGVGTAASGTTGEIRATNNITAYYSDDRLKTRLGSIENALNKLCSLEGFYYEANELAQSLGYEAKREVGVSAQQVQSVLPEIVAPAPIDDKYLTVRYERALPLLIEAIKELRAEVQAIKAKLI